MEAMIEMDSIGVALKAVELQFFSKLISKPNNSIFMLIFHPLKSFRTQVSRWEDIKHCLDCLQLVLSRISNPSYTIFFSLTKTTIDHREE